MENENQQPLILVAEDVDSNFLLLSCILKKMYRLQRAVDGIEVVDMYHQCKPDIILMDMKMPRRDGIEATEIIRKENVNIPIIALTAYAYDSDKDRALSVGCNDYLTKPISIPDLKETITKWIGKKA